MNRSNHVTFRLWIYKLFTVKRKADAFFLGDKQVFSVMVQGIIVNFRRNDNCIQIVLDDATGLLSCTFYYHDYDHIELKTGDLVRVCGKIVNFQDEYRLKLIQPPYIIENFDEEVEWAVSVSKLWNFIYTAKLEIETLKEFPEKKEVKKFSIFDMVKKIRESGQQTISFKDFEDTCENAEDLFLNLMQDGFLTSLDNKSIMEATFQVSPQVFHPKEVIMALFMESEDPISLQELLDFNNGRYESQVELVFKSVNELLEENFLYEVSDSLYSRILYD